MKRIAIVIGIAAALAVPSVAPAANTPAQVSPDMRAQFVLQFVQGVSVSTAVTAQRVSGDRSQLQRISLMRTRTN
jgi:hypothetical protein